MAECDKDNDTYYADTTICGGDDCIDDRAVHQFAALYNPGADEFCDAESTSDFDCDGAPGCSDSDCSTDPACQGGGGDPTYYPNPTYCYSYYAVTDWYISYDGGETWDYYYTDWEYIGSDCHMLYQ